MVAREAIEVALLGAIAKATCLLDIVFVVLSILESYCIRSIHITTDTHGVVEARDNQAITIHQLDILSRTRISQSLVKMNSNGISIAHRYLVECNGVFAISTLTRHLDDSFHTGLLIVAHTAHKTGTTNIGARHCPTRCLDDIRQALVLQLHRVVALESDLAFDGDTDRILEHRAAAHLHDIVRLKGEVRLISQ